MRKPLAVRAMMGILALSVAALVAPQAAIAQGGTGVVQQSMSTRLDDLADQLGTRLAERLHEDMGIGMSFSGTLVDPARLAQVGVTGLHAGARITLLRIARDRFRLEADELEPAPITRKATLKLDERGRLVAVGATP